MTAADLDRFVAAQDADGSYDRALAEVLGGLDAAKLRSSMTLWHRADPEDPAWAAVLGRWWAGVPDPATEELLGA